MSTAAVIRRIVRRLTGRPVSGPPVLTTGNVVVSLDARRELAARERHPAGKARAR